MTSWLVCPGELIAIPGCIGTPKKYDKKYYCKITIGINYWHLQLQGLEGNDRPIHQAAHSQHDPT
jgi:hypothetical protein